MQQEVQSSQVGQLESLDLSFDHLTKEVLHTLRGHLADQDRIITLAPGDHADIRRVALVAGARMGQFGKRHFHDSSIPDTLDLMKSRILAIHAHPDDVEILAGGTMALLAAAGHSITIVSMTPGDCGSAELSSDEIAAVRRTEAGSAAARIGAEYRCAAFRDLAIFNDDASRRRVVEILRRTKPNVVLTSAPIDYMCDHEATSSLVRDACFAAPARNYTTRDVKAAPPLPSIPHLYFMDPVGGVDREAKPVPADFYVDVESV